MKKKKSIFSFLPFFEPGEYELDINDEGISDTELSS